jgi:hypothetical protein
MKMESLSSSEVSLICQGAPGATVAKVGVVWGAGIINAGKGAEVA